MSESLGKCSVCGKEAGVLYPLLPGEPKFCGEHHNPKDAGPFGCDLSGPDDFDIPEPWIDSLEFCEDRETFVWTDREGNKHKLSDVDNVYLQNIISFLRRRLPLMEVLSAVYWSEVVVFLEKEQRLRANV